MADQAADSLEEAAAYSAGFAPQSADRRTATGMGMRGFNLTGAQALYLNGARFPINSFNAPPDPYSYERIELLKGPASVLYGSATPGGIVNLVSKRPTREPLREIELQTGSWSRRQVAADFSGPLDKEGRVGFRLSGLLRDSDTMQKEVPDDRTLLNAALDWRISSAVTLTLLGSYNRSHSMTGTYVAPTSGWYTPNPFGRVPRDLFLGEPDFDSFKSKGTTLGYILDYQINDTWKFRQNFLAYDYEVDNRYTSYRPRVSELGPPAVDRIPRTASTRFDTDRGISLDNQLQGKLRHGRFEHTLLFGMDYYRSTFSRTQRSGTQAPLDLLNPIYGQSDIVLRAPTHSRDNGNQLGFYLQDHIKYDQRWIFLVGARYDDVSGDERFTAATGQVDDSNSKSNALSPRFGVMHLFDNGISPYYSFTRSFQPTSGTDFEGGNFKPTYGNQHEVGVKYDPPGLNASFTVAAYHIVQRNVLTDDRINDGFSVQLGKVRSRGVEVEARTSLSRQLDLIGAYSIMDAEIIESTVASDIGNRPNAAPRNMASIWINYRFDALPGLSMSAGVRRVGRQANVNGEEIVEPVTLYDAALRYTMDRWQFALNVKNLTDRYYIRSCTFQCWYGEERNVILTARYRW